MTEDEIADALRWVARQERLHFGEASLIGGFSFREKDYRRPKYFQTIRDALALAQKVRDGYVLVDTQTEEKSDER